MRSDSGKVLIPLVIWGASGHARVVADIVRLRDIYTIVGFIDDVNHDRHGDEFCGARILGGQEQLETLRNNGVRHLFLAFGDCQARLELSILVRQMGYKLATLLHPKSIVASDVIIGEGTVMMAGAVINPGTQIGENVIINTSSSIDHDCHIENGAHISPGAHLGGGVFVGSSTWIGIGAVVKDKIHIGRNSIIGAGAVVIQDIPDGVVAVGIPAKAIRSVKN